MIAIDWFGPYASVEEAREAAKGWDWPGLYLCIGRTGRARTSSLQYIGIGKSLGNRVGPRHEKIGNGTALRDMRLWLGEVATAEPSGKKLKVTRATLDYAEWLHARFLGLPLNDKKTKSLPPRSTTVLNRWWTTDFEAPRWRANRPHPQWPNLIDYPGEGAPARVVWFGGRQQTFAAPDYLGR